MTKERLNKKIDIALEDAQNKRLTEHHTLKSKIKSFN